MKKQLLIAAATIALAFPTLSSGVSAEPEHGGSRFSQEDVSAFTDAKIAGLKAGLKLNPGQEKNWPAFETALREAAKARAARAAELREKFKDHERVDVIDGLRTRARMMTARGSELEKIAEAAKPLYDSLDDAQKRRLHVLLHFVLRGPGAHGMHGHWGGEHGGDH